jgi:hypothetical protein
LSREENVRPDPGKIPHVYEGGEINGSSNIRIRLPVLSSKGAKK